MAAHPHPRKYRQAGCRSAPAEGSGGPDEAAQFLAGHLAELVALARRHRFDTLVYLLDMGRLEAEDLRRRLSGPGPGL